MRRFAVWAIGIVAVLVAAGGIALQNASVDTWLFTRAVNSQLSEPAPRIAGPTELSVALCGTGSPLPDTTRAGPCALVGAGNKLYIVDTGIDAARNLMLWRVPLQDVAGVFITHLHSDHIGELGEIQLQTWVAGRRVPLKVYGPPGIEKVVAGFNEAYAMDDAYRIKHHGADFLPPEAAHMQAVTIDLNGMDTKRALKTDDGLKVTAIRVNHGPVKPAYGYRFDYAGRSVTISGDTSKDENLAHAAMNSDVLVHEALNPELVHMFEQAALAGGMPRAAKIFHDIPGYHTSPIDAAKVANEAHAKLLVYTHLLPILPNAIAERAFMKGVSDVRPQGVILGRDGMIFRLPGGTDRIEQDQLN